MSLTNPVANSELDCVPAGNASTNDDDPGQVLIAIDRGIVDLSVAKAGPSVVRVCPASGHLCVSFFLSLSSVYL